MKNQIREKGPSIFFLLVFVLGFSICMVPNLIKYRNEVARSNIVSEFIYTAEQRTREEIEEEQALCEAYNEALFSKASSYNPTQDYSILETYGERLKIFECIAALEIPKINLTIPVYRGSDDFTLSKGAGHLKDSSLPVGGVSTHSVLSAHNGDPSSQSFTDLEKLEVGDYFFVSANGSTLTYQVDQISIVDPDDTGVTQIVEGEDYCSLITCTPRNINSHRLIVRGVRACDLEVDDIERGLSSSETSIIYGLITLGVVTAVIATCKYLNENRKNTRNEEETIT